MHNNFLFTQQIQNQFYMGLLTNQFSYPENFNFTYFYQFDPSTKIITFPYENPVQTQMTLNDSNQTP